ncbi:MAG: Uma2 family endonuclease [Gammaproteobacteria bacterium]|nr:Uma2 family endonuclease [Gammaproteobacteria bacterium]MCP5423634.1 Uma2 family endonuclease [Gammaproteobacteria bacterium]MCP5459887.1 Uma2 family endonuclease [Gammaproteobacteria bacterium]
MPTAALQENLYERLMNLPENWVGEIIGGQLYTQPRPAKPHALVCSSLEIEIGAAFQKGRGGPGGWWIIVEPEIHFIRDMEIAVPDLAGWRRERLPSLAGDHRFEIVPDWVCEILSPSTAKKDRVVKMPTYARYGVPYLWLVDPTARTLEAFALEHGRWTVIGLFADEADVAIPPFQEISLALGELWVETGTDDR